MVAHIKVISSKEYREFAVLSRKEKVKIMSNVIHAKDLKAGDLKVFDKEYYVTGPLCETFTVQKVIEKGFHLLSKRKINYRVHNKTSPMKVFGTIDEVKEYVERANMGLPIRELERLAENNK